VYSPTYMRTCEYNRANPFAYSGISDFPEKSMNAVGVFRSHSALQFPSFLSFSRQPKLGGKPSTLKGTKAFNFQNPYTMFL